MDFIKDIFQYLQNLGGYGVFLGVIIETIITPIPSSLVPMAAGFILIPAQTSPERALTLCFINIASFGALAATLGSVFAYSIGYFGGRTVIIRFSKYTGITWEDIEKAKTKMEDRRGHITLVISRIIPIIPLAPVSATAGIIRYNAIPFLALTFIGCLPRYFMLGILGWMLGESLWILSNSIEIIENTVLIAATLIIIMLIYIKKIRKKKIHK